MTDPVTDALARIVAEGGFAIVSDPSRENLYAQFMTGAGSPSLQAELVGNEYLPAGERLDELQMAELRARGWTGDGMENWSREWPDASSEAVRAEAALAAVGALTEVFGARGGVTVEVNVEGPVESTELVQGKARIVLLAVVALAFLGFVVAIIYSAATSP
jgi:hypothetical protein